MGCTSSAPNTASVASTADKSIQIEEDVTRERAPLELDIEHEQQTNETEVLPLRDTFEEPVQLVRNNKSTDSLVNEKDVPVNGHVSNSEDLTDVPDNNKTQEVNNIPKMELLIDKVLETNYHLNETEHKDNVSDSSPADSNKDQVEATAKTNEHPDVTAPLESNDDHSETAQAVQDDAEADETEEEPSPSQSQSSRATRWEALADIAAELPPSLAVDPLTGQIYALTK